MQPGRRSRGLLPRSPAGRDPRRPAPRPRSARDAAQRPAPIAGAGRFRRAPARLGRQRRFAGAGLRRRERHVGGALLVDDGEMARPPARRRAGRRPAPLVRARTAGHDGYSRRHARREISTAESHAAAVGRRGHDRSRGSRSPTGACSMRARLSVIAARSSPSTLSRATSPAPATNPRVAASTQTAVSCPSPNCAAMLVATPRMALRPRIPSRCAARASRPVICCWRWSVAGLPGGRCMRAAGANGHVIRHDRSRGVPRHNGAEAVRAALRGGLLLLSSAPLFCRMPFPGAGRQWKTQPASRRTPGPGTSRTRSTSMA